MTMLLNSAMNVTPALPSFEAITEGARRATGVMASGAPRPDPEVVVIARRRQFSAAEKRRLVNEAERCKARGELGAFLRRERIYSSMLASWRKQIGAADRAVLAPKRRGPKPDLVARQNAALSRDIVRLQKKLERAELIIDAQKKTDCCSSTIRSIGRFTSINLYDGCAVRVFRWLLQPANTRAWF